MTKTTKTTAQTIAARFDNDGQVWGDADGINIDDACQEHSATIEHRDSATCCLPKVPATKCPNR